MEAREADIPRAHLSRFLARLRRRLRLPGEVNVLVTSNAQVQQLNAQFRGKDKPTDVLSFAANGGWGGRLSGELAISAEIAAEQAALLGHDLLTEVKILTLHGTLHLAGYDHEQDRGEMRDLETRLREEFGLPTGLIERNSHSASKPAWMAKRASMTRLTKPRRTSARQTRRAK